MPSFRVLSSTISTLEPPNYTRSGALNARNICLKSNLSMTEDENGTHQHTGRTPKPAERS
jgi:hypothetical protein